MNVDVILSESPCDYCANKYDYNYTGHSCHYWFSNQMCKDCEDFRGKELIEVSE